MDKMRTGRTLLYLYGTLAVLGAVLPYAMLWPWIARHGLDLPLLISQPFVNIPARIFVADALFAAFVFLIFMISESKRLGIRTSWAPVLAVLVAGLCCALPLFLAQREWAIGRSNPLFPEQA